MNLDDLRSQLDEIDQELVSLTERRLAVCEQVADYKLEHHKPVLDASREEQKLTAVRGLVQEERYTDAVEHLFIQIMKDSRALQSERIQEKTMERDG